MPDNNDLMQMYQDRKASLLTAPDNVKRAVGMYIFNNAIAPKIPSGTPDDIIDQARDAWMGGEGLGPSKPASGPVDQPPQDVGILGKASAFARGLVSGAAHEVHQVSKMNEGAAVIPGMVSPGSISQNLKGPLTYLENLANPGREAAPKTTAVGEFVGRSVPDVMLFQGGAGAGEAAAKKLALGKAGSYTAKTIAGTAAMGVTKDDKSAATFAKDVGAQVVFDAILHGVFGKASTQLIGKAIRSTGQEATPSAVEAFTPHMSDVLKERYPEKYAAFQQSQGKVDPFSPEEKMAAIDEATKRQAQAEATQKINEKLVKDAQRETDKAERLKDQAAQKLREKSVRADARKAANSEAKVFALRLSEYRKATGSIPAEGTPVYQKLKNGALVKDVVAEEHGGAVAAAQGVADQHTSDAIAVEHPTAIDAVKSAQAAAHVVQANEKSSTGLENLGGAGTAIADNLYVALYKKLEVGDLTEGGKPSEFLQNAKKFFDLGQIKSPRDLRRLAERPEKYKISNVEAPPPTNPPETQSPEQAPSAQNTPEVPLAEPGQVGSPVPVEKPKVEKPKVEKAAKEVKQTAYERFGVKIDPTAWKTPEDVIAGKSEAMTQMHKIIKDRTNALQAALLRKELTPLQVRAIATKMAKEITTVGASIEKIKTPEIGRDARDRLRQATNASEAMTAEKIVRDGRQSVAKTKIDENAILQVADLAKEFSDLKASALYKKITTDFEAAGGGVDSYGELVDQLTSARDFLRKGKQ
jgi:hypothetical protein